MNRGAATPPYLVRHAGPCLVAGSAECLPADVARARQIFGDVPVIAVNGAAREIKAFALFSYHPERMVGLGWLTRQRTIFHGSSPRTPGFTVHATQGLRSPKATHPWVDHWWPGATGSGGSAWGARKVAAWMGFSPVILVGCPLVPGPYVGNHGLGGLMHDGGVVDAMLRGIEADAEWHAGAFSMSGRTMEILGAPC